MVPSGEMLLIASVSVVILVTMVTVLIKCASCGDDDYYYDYGIGPQKNYPAVDQIRQLPAVPLAPRALPQTASRMMPPKASRVMPEKGPMPSSSQVVMGPQIAARQSIVNDMQRNNRQSSQSTLLLANNRSAPPQRNPSMMNAGLASRPSMGLMNGSQLGMAIGSPPGGMMPQMGTMQQVSPMPMMSSFQPAGMQGLASMTMLQGGQPAMGLMPTSQSMNMGSTTQPMAMASNGGQMGMTTFAPSIGMVSTTTPMGMMSATQPMGLSPAQQMSIMGQASNMGMMSGYPQMMQPNQLVLQPQLLPTSMADDQIDPNTAMMQAYFARGSIAQ